MEGIRRIETIIRSIEQTADAETRDRVRELVESLLEYHGAGLARILELIRESAPSGEGTVRALARDPLVSSMLLLYGLHPDDFETRVRRAVDALRNVELAGIEGFAVRLKITGAVAREAVEQTVYAAAPETAALEIEGLEAPAAFVPLEAILRV
jgi:hypothetical protein